MVLAGLLFALYMFVIISYLQVYQPEIFNKSLITGHYDNVKRKLQKEYLPRSYNRSFNVPDIQSFARKELEIAMQRVCQFLYVVSYENSYNLTALQIWDFALDPEDNMVGSVRNMLTGWTSNILSSSTISDGSYGRFLIRRNIDYRMYLHYLDVFKYDFRFLDPEGSLVDLGDDSLKSVCGFTEILRY